MNLEEYKITIRAFFPDAIFDDMHGYSVQFVPDLTGATWLHSMHLDHITKRQVAGLEQMKKHGIAWINYVQQYTYGTYYEQIEIEAFPFILSYANGVNDGYWKIHGWRKDILNDSVGKAWEQGTAALSECMCVELLFSGMHANANLGKFLKACAMTGLVKIHTAR